MLFRLALFAALAAIAVSIHASEDFQTLFFVEKFKPSTLFKPNLRRAFKGVHKTEVLKGALVSICDRVLLQLARPRQSYGRRLLQEAVCEWDEEDGVCLPSAAATISILSEAEGGLAQFLAATLTCTSAEAEDSCDGEAGCLWEADGERCVFADLSVGNEESPCVANAPSTLAIFAAVDVCEAEAVEETCLATPNCEWDGSACSADAFAVFIGTSFSEFDDATDAVTPELVAAAVQAFTEEYPTAFSNPEFDWGVALNWDVPSLDCPEGTDPLVCDFAISIVQDIVATVLYCSGRYGDALEADCDADAVCLVNPEDGDCEPAEPITNLARNNAVTALTEGVVIEADREILQTAVGCANLDEGDCTSACLWDVEAQDCSVSVTSIVSTIAAAGAESTDGLCNYFTFLAESGCYSQTDEEACLENDLCSYDEVRGCLVDNTTIIDAALNEDSAVERAFEAAASDCAGLRRRACEA